MIFHNFYQIFEEDCVTPLPKLKKFCINFLSLIIHFNLFSFWTEWCDSKISNCSIEIWSKLWKIMS